MKKIYNLLEWFNGFSFRFFLVFGGWFFALIIVPIAIFVLFLITVSWIFLGSERSWKEFRTTD